MTEEKAFGSCQCGCGGRAPIAKKTNNSAGHVKGQPKKFISGHNWRDMKRVAKPKKIIDDQGYVRIYAPGHPKATATSKYVKEHILIAEKVLGRPLRGGECVHHIDGNRANNQKSNLVIMPGNAYHMMIHRRMRAIEGCGDPNSRRCLYCGDWDGADNLYITPNNAGVWHRRCYNQFRNQYNAEKRG